MVPDPREPEAEAETEPGTFAGTAAASPRALAQLTTPAGGSHASTRLAASPALALAGTGGRPAPTAADGFDLSDAPRMRAFHWFGAVVALVAIGASLVIGGDPIARAGFWAGAGVLALANLGLVWLAGRPVQWRPQATAALWIAATSGILPAVYYFGPFSAVMMVLMLGQIFIAIGRDRTTALVVVIVAIGGHLALAVPIIAGWIRDVGVVSSAGLGVHQLVIAEVLIVTTLGGAFSLGRWARHTSASALAELGAAMRVIGDQQQALAEVVDEQARLQRQNEGRWTGQTMGSFRLGLVLGRGAMGEVYEATGPDGTPAAVKLLNQRATDSSALVERFHREMAVAARLASPHIVRVYELSRPDAPVPYIAMERLYGADLAARLRVQTRMPSDELVVLVDHVARALEVARLAGVVHRDLKPHNLFLHEGGAWKVLDFGVSKVAGGEGTLTGDGIVGTPQYMAPEQATGGEVTHAADVYALGAIAYRCLTGRAPFRGRDLSEVIYQLVHAAPMRPGLLVRAAPAIEDVLAVAMAKDPRRRFPSAQAFAQAFVAARRGIPAAIEPPPGAWSG